MNKPIRVLHVLGALNPGGVETFIMNLYRQIDTSIVQFDFALTQGKKSFFDDEVLERGGRIYYFDQNKKISTNLSRVIKNCGPYSAVHSHVYFYSGVVLLIAKMNGVQIRIAHAHNTAFGKRETIIRKSYELIMRKMVLTYATHLLGCSIDACRYVFGTNCMSDPRCNVFYNAFDIFSYVYDSKGRKEIRDMYSISDHFVVGHVGRFEKQKNHMQLVEHFSEFLKLKEDSILLLVGRGRLMDSVHEKCIELGIENNVVFAGAQKNTQPYYSAMDLFLFPSLYEGLGTVLIEAQANGLPCVTTEKEVPYEVDVSGKVTFVPLNSPSAIWARKMLDATFNIENRSCPKKVWENYDIRQTAKTITQIYIGNDKRK